MLNWMLNLICSLIVNIFTNECFVLHFQCKNAMLILEFFKTDGDYIMSQTRPRMTNLFEQLGLDSSEEAIQDFIENHQLDADTFLTKADFWTEAQRQFLDEKLSSDGEWATIVDQLNESLHEDSVK